jgi:hypothetical protein
MMLLRKYIIKIVDSKVDAMKSEINQQVAAWCDLETKRSVIERHRHDKHAQQVEQYLRGFNEILKEIRDKG